MKPSGKRTLRFDGLASVPSFCPTQGDLAMHILWWHGPNSQYWLLHLRDGPLGFLREPGLSPSARPKDMRSILGRLSGCLAALLKATAALHRHHGERAAGHIQMRLAIAGKGTTK